MHWDGRIKIGRDGLLQHKVSNTKYSHKCITINLSILFTPPHTHPHTHMYDRYVTIISKILEALNLRRRRDGDLKAVHMKKDVKSGITIFKLKIT